MTGWQRLWTGVKHSSYGAMSFQRETLLLVLQETSAALLEGISQKLGMVLIDGRKALTIPEDASPEHPRISAEIDLRSGCLF